MTKIEEYYIADQAYKKAKAKRDKLREMLILEYDVGEYEVEGYSLKIAESTSKRLNTKAVRTLLGINVGKYEKASVSTKVTVKKV
jgi:hypothetical protein